MEVSMLADRQPTKPKRMPCSIGALLTVLPASERDALLGMLATRDWSDAAIWKACTEEQHDISLWMIGHHRRKNCSCGR
jgi:hypothetical protein